jgi:hypothetical protein
VAGVIVNSQPSTDFAIEVRDAITEWFGKRHPVSVDFRDTTHPDNDPIEDYEAVYEAWFKPRAANIAQIALFVTSDSQTAIGFECRGRIAQRIGVKTPKPNRIAGRHEPLLLTVEGIIAILDAAANGEMCVLTRQWPFVGLVSTSVIMAEESLAVLHQRGYHATSWIRPAKEAKHKPSAATICFAPWS